MLDTIFWISAGAVFVLICLSAFFSGSETALTAASLARLHSLSKQGNKRADIVMNLLEKKDRLIGALLLGNNLVNILATSLTTSVLVKLFGEAGVVYATFFMTLLVLIFAEVLPKTYAINNSDRMALGIAPIIRVLVKIFSPITEMIARLVYLTLKMIGVDIHAVSVGNHVEELKGAIDLHQGENEGVQEERAMLRSILELADVDVTEIMVHRRNVQMLSLDVPVKELVKSALDSPYTRIPIWQEDQDNIVGVLHTKLLLRELYRVDARIEDMDIKAAMLDPWFIPETTTLFDQLQEFRSRREHFALMVDEYGSLVGVVTLEDILEEIVGEIDDESDEVVTGVEKQTDGTYLVDGNVTIRDLNREFDWDLPVDEEYSTMAGLLLFESQSIPNVGQTFIFHGFRLEVILKQRSQITQIKVKPLTKKHQEKHAEKTEEAQ